MLGLLLEKGTHRHSKLGSAEDQDYTPNAPDAPKDRDGAFDFALALSNQFSVAEQLGAMIQLQRDLLRLPAEKPAQDQPDEYSTDHGLVELSRMTNKQLRAYKLLVLQFANKLLTSTPFLSKLHEDIEAENVALEDGSVSVESPSIVNDNLFTQLIESLLRVITSIGAQYSQVATSKKLVTSVEQMWRQTLHESYNVLDTANELLVLPHFVLVVRHLLSHENRTIRRKVLDLVNIRVTYIGNGDEKRTESVISQILSLLHPLQNLIQTPSPHDSDITEERAGRFVPQAVTELPLMKQLSTSKQPCSVSLQSPSTLLQFDPRHSLTHSTLSFLVVDLNIPILKLSHQPWSRSRTYVMSWDLALYLPFPGTCQSY